MACDLTLSYDENLMDNLFFQKLQKEFNELFFKTISEGCIICVPRAGSLPKYPLTLEDFLTHILVPTEELPESHFRSLCGYEIKINNHIININREKGRQSSVNILFQETFYTNEGLKYVVLCIEHPFDGGANFLHNKSITALPNNLRDCLDLVWSECGTHETIENIDKEIESFLKKYSTVDASDIHFIRDSVFSLYNKCVQILLKNPDVKNKTKSQKCILKNLKIAIEAYIQHSTYKKIIKDVSTSTAVDDAQLNKIVRNFSDLHFKEFKIKSKYYTSIPKARLELSRINGYSTTLGKIGCLRKTVIALSETQSSKSVLSADDLLQLFAFLIIKTNLPNWNAQLNFLKIFQFSDFSSFDENNFLVTSLEAAIAYVQSEIFCSIDGQAKMGFEDNLKNCGKELLNSNEKTLKEKTLHDFFHDIALGELEKVKEVLNKKEPHINNFSFLCLCHPLCNCEKCFFLIYKNLCESHPTVNSFDDQGLTALHIAAMYGVPNIVEYLLANKADPNAADYDGRTPVHYAALRGHQNALLLLIHNNIDINALDNLSNTPLHLCVENGHESCVKALIYFSEYLGVKLQINHRNNRGDTPLHSASKWGYVNIVKILLEYGGDPSVLNKRKLSAIDYSHNVKISEILKQKCLTTNTYIKIKTVNPVLDLCDQIEKSPNQVYKGIQANSVDAIKKVEKVLRAVENGDVNLVCFYLGIDANEFEEKQNIFNPKGESANENKRCHPLCVCANCKLFESTENENLSDTKRIKKKGLTINICNSEGYTPLHVASKHGHLDLVKGFIRNGALLNVQTAKLMTPLMLACQNQNLKVVKELLDCGCQIDLQDRRMNTALHYSCYTGNTKLVEILLKYEPNISLKNDENKTALQIAKEKLSLGIVKILKGGKPFNLDDC